MMALRQVLCNKNDLLPCQVWRQICPIIRACVRARVGQIGVRTLIG